MYTWSSLRLALPCSALLPSHISDKSCHNESQLRGSSWNWQLLKQCVCVFSLYMYVMYHKMLFRNSKVHKRLRRVSKQLFLFSTVSLYSFKMMAQLYLYFINYFRQQRISLVSCFSTQSLFFLDLQNVKSYYDYHSFLFTIWGLHHL